MTVLATHIKPMNESVVKHFMWGGVGVKEQGGVCAYVDCLDQCTNQNHVCSLAEEMSLKRKGGKRPANRRINVLNSQNLRVIW